eukprot:scaffold56065_cov34-Phaeocystis_antarctica.AAC.2
MAGSRAAFLMVRVALRDAAAESTCACACACAHVHASIYAYICARTPRLSRSRASVAHTASCLPPVSARRLKSSASER